VVIGQEPLPLYEVGSRRLSAEQQEGDGAEGEHVEGDAVGIVDDERLRGEVHMLVGAQALQEVVAERRSRGVGVSRSSSGRSADTRAGGAIAADSSGRSDQG